MTSLLTIEGIAKYVHSNRELDFPPAFSVWDSPLKIKKQIKNRKLLAQFLLPFLKRRENCNWLLDSRLYQHYADHADLSVGTLKANDLKRDDIFLNVQYSVMRRKVTNALNAKISRYLASRLALATVDKKDARSNNGATRATRTLNGAFQIFVRRTHAI